MAGSQRKNNVFINCPFDEAYLPLLRPLLFCVLYLGLTPRIALERQDSGEQRIQKLLQLIRESAFSIHDISRLQATEPGEFYRLNMPFELGLDIGSRTFGGGYLAEKACLMLEAKPFRYQAAISDMAGADIAVHKNEPKEVVRVVRNWLRSQKFPKADPPTKIWNRFNDFMADNYDRLKERDFSDEDIELLTVNELIDCMTEWIDETL